ncbi:MAG: glycogen-binding domain-containing protein [Brevinematia bacterium]
MKKALWMFVALAVGLSLIISCTPATKKEAASGKSTKVAKSSDKESKGGGVVKAGAIKFTFNAKEYGGASSVNLVGSFNGWNPTDPNYTMEDPDGDGIFEITVEWDPGKYIYKYYIDGNWPKDMSELEQYISPKPAEYVDDGFGGKNAVLVVE